MTTFIIKHRRFFSALYEGWLKSMSEGVKQDGCATDSVIFMVYVDIAYYRYIHQHWHYMIEVCLNSHLIKFVIRCKNQRTISPVSLT